jgi:hypothetical protein
VNLVNEPEVSGDMEDLTEGSNKFLEKHLI